MIAAVNALMEKHKTNCPCKLCSKLGIRIKTLDLPSNIRGLCVVSNAKRYILINSSIESHIDRCVVMAHELGHAVLHSDCVIQASTRGKTEGMHEYQANLFAAHLLTGGKDIPCYLKKEIRRCSHNADRTHNLLVRLSFTCSM